MNELNHADCPAWPVVTDDDAESMWLRQPMAAEACTDMDDDYPVNHRARAIVWCTYLSVLAVAVGAALAVYL